MGDDRFEELVRRATQQLTFGGDGPVDRWELIARAFKLARLGHFPPIDLVDENVYECTEWDPAEAAVLQQIQARRDDWFSKNPEVKRS